MKKIYFGLMTSGSVGHKIVEFSGTATLEEFTRIAGHRVRSWLDYRCTIDGRPASKKSIITEQNREVRISYNGE